VTETRNAPNADVLRQLDESLAGLTGREFFSALASTVAHALSAHCAFVCEFVDGNSRAEPFAFWLDSRPVDVPAFALDGTPCERVLGGDIVMFKRDVCAEFPRDREGLEALRAESYIAIPMKSRDGAIIGHVAVIDERPRDWAEADLGALRLCASRATAELEHLRIERELERRVLERTRELEAARDEMEQRVLERTATLSAVNTRLRHEIAARTEAEGALRRQEEAYRDLYEHAPNVYWSTGADGYIKRMNQRAADMFGRTPEEIVGQHFTTLIADSPENMARAMQTFNRFLAGETTFGQEFEFRGANGRRIWASVNVVPIFDDDGKPVATRTTIQDISERKRAQDALQRRLDLEQVLTEVATGFVSARPDDVDRAFERAIARIGAWGRWDRVRVFLYEQSKSEAMLSHEWRADAAPHAATAAPLIPRRLLRRRDEVVDVPRVTEKREGAFDSVLAAQGVGGLIVVPVANSSAWLGFIELACFGRGHEWLKADVQLLRLLGEIMASTLQRCAAERELDTARAGAEAASQAKSEFLARMSHELRTPLNAILGYAQLLQRDDDLGGSQRMQIETIRRSGEHLLALINEVLDLARVESGKLEIAAVDLDLAALVRDIGAMFKARAENASLKFGCELEEPFPARIRADDRRLRQVLINLLGNAVKFTPAGGDVRLRVRSRRVGGERWLVMFSVSDTGIGIAEHDLPRIFEPFYQVLERKAEGIGLGLAITRRLVEAMAGELKVVSELGKGTTFTLTLEATELVGVIVARAERVALKGYAGTRRTVLVADDHHENRAVLASYLEPLGFTVLEAEDGEAAAAAVASSAPDVVLMDLVMPKLDGLGAVGRIRALPLGDQVKIVAVSANAFEEARTNSLAEGCDAFLTKPVDFEELRRTLGVLLDIDWQYDDAPSDGAVEPPAVAVVLPAERLAVLYDLARKGDVTALDSELDALAAEPAHVVFAAELRTFIARMDMRGAERRLEPLIGDLRAAERRGGEPAVQAV
jgi:PAS domain S-box-containing protein